ncbi:hypothetical protein AMTRI_Chr07g81840 [Amborella trichopoda]
MICVFSLSILSIFVRMCNVSNITHLKSDNFSIGIGIFTEIFRYQIVRIITDIRYF